MDKDRAYPPGERTDRSADAPLAGCASAASRPPARHPCLGRVGIARPAAGAAGLKALGPCLVARAIRPAPGRRPECLLKGDRHDGS